VLIALILLVVLFMMMEMRELKESKAICNRALTACGFKNVSMFTCDVCRMCHVFCPRTAGRP